jgi:hypothetical protein
VSYDSRESMTYLLRMFEGDNEVGTITVETLPAVRRADDIVENYPKIGQIIDGWEVIEYISYTGSEVRVRVQRPAM